MTVELPMRFEDHRLLWTVDGIYSAQECAERVALIERSAPVGATQNVSFRDMDRVMIDDGPGARDLFERLRPHLPQRLGVFELVGLNERLRYYRYRPGQKFTPHMDHWYRPSADQITLLTVLVYFNSGFEGGQTRFMEQLEGEVVPEPGRVAIFQHKIRHEGCPVISGTKYAMRTDVIYRADGPIGHVTL